VDRLERSSRAQSGGAETRAAARQSPAGLARQARTGARRRGGRTASNASRCMERCSAMKAAMTRVTSATTWASASSSPCQPAPLGAPAPPASVAAAAAAATGGGQPTCASRSQSTARSAAARPSCAAAASGFHKRGASRVSPGRPWSTALQRWPWPARCGKQGDTAHAGHVLQQQQRPATPAPGVLAYAALLLHTTSTPTCS